MPVFGVSVSVTFHVMRVHIIFVRFGSEWLPFRKELSAPLAICSHCVLTICYFNYFPFWFDLTWDVIASVLGLCILLLFITRSVTGHQAYNTTGRPNMCMTFVCNLPLPNKQAPLRKKIRTNEIKGRSKIIYKLAWEARRALFVQNFPRRYIGIIL